MTPSPRSSGSVPYPLSRPGSGVATSVPVYEIIKARVLIKVQDRLDVSKSRRMPASLFAETARQQIEQVIEAEAARLTRAERDQLVEEAYTEAFGYGPLEELFADPTVREITVVGPHAVLARRDQGWVPTNVKFRDADHLLEVLDKVRAGGEAVGAVLPASVLDVKLGNGFRVVAVIPPPAIGQPPTATFVRSPDAANPYRPPAAGTGSHPVINLNGTGSHAAINLSGSAAHTPLPKAASATEPVPAARPSAVRSPAPGEYPLERHRVRITERLIKKLASLGVYDLSRVDTTELRKVVAAYVTEYCEVEKVLLSETDQDRLTVEIISAMNR